jgi:hypothetical protein
MLLLLTVRSIRQARLEASGQIASPDTPVQFRPKEITVSRNKTGPRAVVAAVLATVLVMMAAGTAHAAGGYSTYSGSTWNVRSCPSTCAVGTTISGPIPNLVCQTSGPAVTLPGFGTSTIYDLVKAPSGLLGYMSDLGVRQTPYGVFSPNLPRCDARPGPTTEAVTSAGYGWIPWCSYRVLSGKLWACWAAGLRYLFIPDSAM